MKCDSFIPFVILCFLHCLSSCQSISSDVFCTSLLNETDGDYRQGLTCILPKTYANTKCDNLVPNGTVALFDCPFSNIILSQGQSGQGRMECVAEGDEGVWKTVVHCRTCGQPDSLRMTRFVHRIWGNPSDVTEADPAEWPWHATLYHKTGRNNGIQYKCGGTLIHDQFVLTAAHCVLLVSGPRKSQPVLTEDIVVVLGAVSSAFRNNELSPDAQIFSVSSVRSNGHFSLDRLESDIAILKLSSPVKYTSKVMPACMPDAPLPQADDRKNSSPSMGHIVGFGKIAESRDIAPTLKHAELPVISLNKCKSEKFSPQPTQFCAGYTDDTATPCSGDSGGGLVFKSDNRFYVHGIVSYGKDTRYDKIMCQGYVVFTRVHMYKGWILETLTSLMMEVSQMRIRTETPTDGTSTTVRTTDVSSTTRKTVSSTRSTTVRTRTNLVYKPYQTTVRPISHKCGQSYFKDKETGSKRQKRIIGGDTAEDGKWPWMISLTVRAQTTDYEKRCGATLLNENWAITTADCVYSETVKSIILKLGTTDLHQTGVIREVKRIVVHRDFKPFSAPDYKYSEVNLALLQFKSPVTLSSLIYPICLPGLPRRNNNRYYATEDSESEPQYSTGYVAGWGRTIENDRAVEFSTQLKDIKLPIDDIETCKQAYNTDEWVLTNNYSICTGAGGYEKGLCNNDGGGPLMIENEKDGFWEIIGIFSQYEYCDLWKPSVFVRISTFVPWIANVINRNWQ